MIKSTSTLNSNPIINLAPRLSPSIQANVLAEYDRYEENARRCGYWPYKPLRILQLEQLIAAATLSFNQESEAAA